MIASALLPLLDKDCSSMFTTKLSSLVSLVTLTTTDALVWLAGKLNSQRCLTVITCGESVMHTIPRIL